MHPRLSELFAYIDRERAALLATLDRIPLATRGRRPAPDRWSVNEVVEHLAVVERRIAAVVAKSIAEARERGLGPERDASPILPTLDTATIVDRTMRIEAPRPIQPTGTLDPATATATLAETRRALLDAATTGDGLALGEAEAPHPRFGPLTLYHWIAFVGAHEARHRAQIEEIVGTLDAE